MYAGIIPNIIPTITDVNDDPIKVFNVSTGLNGINIPAHWDNKNPTNIPNNPPNNVTNIEFPIEGYAISNSFKIYIQDTGLLMAMLDRDVMTAIFSDNLGIYKGNIYENAVASTFLKNDIELFYYQNSYEIDFLTTFNLNIVPVEVKAKDGRSKSLNTLMTSNKKIQLGIRIKNKNIGLDNNVLTIPHYLSFMVTKDNMNKLITEHKLFTEQ